MHESTADANFAVWVEVFQKGVSVCFDPVEEAHPAIPAAISLLMSRFGDALFPGHFCAMDAIQEICFCGRSMILICEVERDGWSEVSMAIICSFDR